MSDTKPLKTAKRKPAPKKRGRKIQPDSPIPSFEQRGQELVEYLASKGIRPSEPSTPRLLIHSAIMAIMAEVGPIVKKHEHDEEGFNFRLIDEMTTALQPRMVQHNVYPMIRVLKHWQTDRATRTGNLMVTTVVKSEFRLVCALDGSMSEPDIAMGEAISDSSYSTNSAQTMALKQFIWQKFFIPALNRDDQESQDAVPDLAPTQVVTQSRPSEPAQPDLFSEPVSSDNPPLQYAPGRRKRAKITTDTPAETQRRIAPEAKVSKGSLAIMRAHLSSKPGVTEALVCEKFEITTIEDLRQSQLNDVKDFIDTYQPAAAENEGK